MQHSPAGLQVVVRQPQRLANAVEHLGATCREKKPEWPKNQPWSELSPGSPLRGARTPLLPWHRETPPHPPILPWHRSSPSIPHTAVPHTSRVVPAWMRKWSTDPENEGVYGCALGRPSLQAAAAATNRSFSLRLSTWAVQRGWPGIINIDRGFRACSVHARPCL